MNSREIVIKEQGRGEHLEGATFFRVYLKEVECSEV